MFKLFVNLGVLRSIASIPFHSTPKLEMENLRHRLQFVLIRARTRALFLGISGVFYMEDVDIVRYRYLYFVLWGISEEIGGHISEGGIFSSEVFFTN